MGNAPGLKAEIAKLHATERAKLALRDFERLERRRSHRQERQSAEGPSAADLSSAAAAAHARRDSVLSTVLQPNAWVFGLGGGGASHAEPGAGGGDRLSLQGWWFNGHARPTSQKTCEQRRPSTKTSTRSGFGECGSDRLALVTVNGAGGSMSRDEHMRYVA
jgi:hypothetical protein